MPVGTGEMNPAELEAHQKTERAHRKKECNVALKEYQAILIARGADDLIEEKKVAFQLARQKFIEAHEDYLMAAKIDPDDDPNNKDLAYMDVTNNEIMENNKLVSTVLKERQEAAAKASRDANRTQKLDLVKEA